MTRKYITPKASDDEEEKDARKKRRLKVAHGGQPAKLGRKRKHRDDGGSVGLPPQPEPEAPKPSWYRPPDPEGAFSYLKPLKPLTDEEFKARWGSDAKPWTPETNNPDRKRGGKVKR